MSALVARCPACGADVTWKTGSAPVLICAYCGSAIARGDRGPESLGKVADLVDSGSPLQVGLRGRLGPKGETFELVGRVQLQHPQGGVWDEWYAAFSGERWGWLAEAQGHFFMTFLQKAPTDALPRHEWIEVAQQVALPGAAGPFTVIEKATAKAGFAQGEIPYRFQPGADVPYIDLSGPQGGFATLDYSDEAPHLYAGREMTLADLGLAEAAAAPREARQIKAAELRCPNCHGPLPLRAPDRTQRVACPSCAALLDVSQGKLAYLGALAKPKVEPAIPIGTVGTLRGTQFTVIGFLERSVESDGVRYPWHEFLLYEPHAGFRWLVESDGHYSFVEPLAAGEIAGSDGPTPRFGGRSYRLFQDGTARVDVVLGELYWKVAAGEQAYAADYVAPPRMLSKEIAENEVNWSLGTYLPPAEVARAFGVKDLPDPIGVAPNQPFPATRVLRLWPLFLGLTLVIAMALAAARRPHKAFEQLYTLDPVASAQATQTVFSEPFALDGHKNVRVTLSAPLDNAWVYVEGDLINEDTGLVQTFATPVEYYSGYDSDGRWSEGDHHPALYLSALPAGTYTLRLECQWQHWDVAQPLGIRIDEGVPRGTHLGLALLGVSFLPLLVLFRRVRFEARRWSKSDYLPTGAKR